jgi:hypothetical protein
MSEASKRARAANKAKRREQKRFLIKQQLKTPIFTTDFLGWKQKRKRQN